MGKEDQYQPPPGPPPGSYQNQPSNHDNNHHYSTATAQAGPPQYHAPPPSQPPAPPSSAPSHPPQPHADEPPPYENWTSVPDTSLLPPPPGLTHKISPTANASERDAFEGAKWSTHYPLWIPKPLLPSQRELIQAGALELIKQAPPTTGWFAGKGYIGDVIALGGPGHYKCRTHASCSDSILLTHLPAYSATHHSPLVTGRPATIYFELRNLGIGRDGRKSDAGWAGPQLPRDEKGFKKLFKGFSHRRAEQNVASSSSSSSADVDSGIAIGYCAPPYPPFRLPGWHRGSLAVHSDDGHKYINNDEGGEEFTRPFDTGAQVVGLGMTFSLPSRPPAYEGGSQNQLDIEVFFTRDGVRDGGWDGNAELDQVSKGGSYGLKGECDLFPAIGVFGSVDFEVVFNPNDWLYQPPNQ